ncbi:MAG: uridylate kinase [Clostridia bacterium]|nr:uridylate kinase [Clostridia bacterium]MDE7329317.1 uridylate kinase [Clostridia bacterium]
MKFDIELVGKVGSMALVNKKWGDIDYNAISRISRELRPGYIWVTSGATEIGRIDHIRRNGKEIAGNYSEVKMDYAAQGQTILMNNYRQYIDPKFGVRQILVEHRHFNDPAKKENLKSLLLRCPMQNAIPIVNYNDPLSSEEIDKLELQELAKARKDIVHCMDNDETASQIACLVKCKTLLIYTSTLGIYADPDDESTLIEKITGKDTYELIEAVAQTQNLCKGASRVGANGANAKLEFIKQPLQNGTQVYIANPKFSITEVLSGQAPCTKIFVSK